MSFTALLVSEQPDKTFTRAIVQRELESLPAHDTLVRVHYSALNYKDALSATGNKGVTRKFPHTPGIDAAGVIVESARADLKPGDEVIVTSYELGTSVSGGYGQYIRVPAGWVVKRPAGLSLREAMILGTAGFTAGLCLQRLEHMGVHADSGEILVTGATGGVGSMAVAMLGKMGYTVVAATGKMHEADWLKQLGAASVVHRDELTDNSRPMLSMRWAGVVDTVGGNMLSNAIKSTKYNGCVTACGLVQSPELHTTVYPFILRGVSLCGVDSGETPMKTRQPLWDLLAATWKPADLHGLADEVGLEQLEDRIGLILRGGVKGRVLVKLP